ncbi:MAG: helix-turn-helix domain-containing protein [Alphaproteobacteria bacterium]|nr:MAG: helix-turn-helix domain-containing protein [Alphaproteobacteria bacterium]
MLGAEATLSGPTLTVDLGAVAATDRVDHWRALLRPLVDVQEIAGDSGRLYGRLTIGQIGDGLLGTLAGSAQTLGRSRSDIAAGIKDIALVQLLIDGTVAGTCDGRSLKAMAGDVVLTDLARPFALSASGFTMVVLAVGRDRLLRALGDGDLHGRVLPATAPGIDLVAMHLTALARRRDPPAEPLGTAAVEAVLVLLSGAYRLVVGGGDPVRGAIALASRQAVVEMIEGALDEPDLTPDWVARRTRLSRSTLYRLFEADGGVAAFIRDRRLDRCFAEIAQPGARAAGIGEIAYRSGFVSEAHFSRAFRRRFGVPPSDVRRMGGQREEGEAAPAPRSAAERLASWVAGLSVKSIGTPSQTHRRKP